MSWTIHQGQNRVSSQPGATLRGIILTTSQTVEAENPRTNSKSDALSAVHWRRIILDEGEAYN